MRENDKAKLQDVSDKAAWSIIKRYHSDFLDKMINLINTGDDQEEREIMAALIQGAVRHAALPATEQ